MTVENAEGEGEKAAAHKRKRASKNLNLSERTDRKNADSPDFGVEGTNKTLPEPDVHAEPSLELAGTPAKNIPSSPFMSRTI